MKRITLETLCQKEITNFKYTGKIVIVIQDVNPFGEYYPLKHIIRKPIFKFNNVYIKHAGHEYQVYMENDILYIEKDKYFI